MKRKFDASMLEKALALFVESTRLCVTYGMILTTPAKEIKRMKLRQIKKELESLMAKAKKEGILNAKSDL